MKKIILIFLALVMALSFAACSSSKVAPNEKNTQKDNGTVNSIPDSGENTQMEIKEPELVWWTIKLIRASRLLLQSLRIIIVLQ